MGLLFLPGFDLAGGFGPSLRVIPICPSLQKGQQSYFPWIFLLEEFLVGASSQFLGERCLQELKGFFVRFVHTEIVCELWEHLPVLGTGGTGAAGIQQGLAAL